MKNSLNGYQQNYENSYMQPEYYDERVYYGDRGYMSQMQGYHHMYGNGGGHGHGALYQYMQHANNYMMYPHDNQHQRRY